MSTRPVCVWDIEIYVNWFAIGFLEVGGRERMTTFERSDTQKLNIPALMNLLQKWQIVSFNGINFDIPILSLALMGAKTRLMKQCCDDIIQGGLRYWEVEQQYNCYIPQYVDHIDLAEVSPGSPQKPSLKLYAGRMHSAKMQELPINHSKEVNEHEIELLRKYHVNDLRVTRDLYLELKPQIDLRVQMSERYGVDVRSKSDAQVAEAVIKTEVLKRTGSMPQRPEIKPGQFYFKAPSFIKFETPQLQDLLRRITSEPFQVYRDGKVHPPTGFESGVKVMIGDLNCKVGMGGLHSQEKKVSYFADENVKIIDEDVASFYPNIILGQGLYPKQLGKEFLHIYKDIYDRRIAAKKNISVIKKKIADVKAKIQKLEDL